jgi:hypothetical protein
LRGKKRMARRWFCARLTELGMTVLRQVHRWGEGDRDDHLSFFLVLVWCPCDATGYQISFRAAYVNMVYVKSKKVKKERHYNLDYSNLIFPSLLLSDHGARPRLFHWWTFIEHLFYWWMFCRTLYSRLREQPGTLKHNI